MSTNQLIQIEAERLNLTERETEILAIGFKLAQNQTYEKVLNTIGTNGFIYNHNGTYSKDGQTYKLTKEAKVIHSLELWA